MAVEKFKQDIKLQLNDEMAKLIALRHRGGAANEKGHRFENGFLAYRVLKVTNELLDTPKELDNHFFATQVYAAVDDVVETFGAPYPTEQDYHKPTQVWNYQCKDTKAVWNAQFEKDFVAQHKINKDVLSAEGSAVNLVVSCEDLTKNNNEKITLDFANCIFFPSGSSLEKIQSFADLKIQLIHACRTESLDVLVAALSLFKACEHDSFSLKEFWVDMKQKARPTLFPGVPVFVHPSGRKVTQKHLTLIEPWLNSRNVELSYIAIDGNFDKVEVKSQLFSITLDYSDVSKLIGHRKSSLVVEHLGSHREMRLVAAVLKLSKILS